MARRHDEGPAPTEAERRREIATEVAAAPRPLLPVPVAGRTVPPSAESQPPVQAEPPIVRLRRIAAAGPAQASAPVDRGQHPRPGTEAPIGRGGGPLDEATSAAIGAQLGSGAPLAPWVRQRMEAAFGTPLGHVRVHDGPAADRLSDAVAADAFTLGRDVFLGGRVTADQPSGERVLAHEIAHALAEPADVARLRRWWEPRKGGPQPDPKLLPRARKQPDGIRWDEVVKEPRAAFRFVDADNKGWEAPDATKPFVQTDWHRAAERAAVWWFDATDKKWRQGDPPPDRRKAMAEERPDVGTELHGYPSAAAVPVYVRARYRPTKDSKKTKRERGPGLRALDRAARVLMQDMPAEGTPHLATASVGGRLLVAGNTGPRNVTTAAAKQADENLGQALNPRRRPTGRRATKDATKLRALQSGDYRAAHPDADAELRQVSQALTSAPSWGNVDVGGSVAEHGEMTVLAQLHKELVASPNRTGHVIVRKLGGVKLACGACELAFEAYNRFIAAGLGYAVEVSGTHGGFYNGWRTPDVIWADHSALTFVRDGLPEGAVLDKLGVLRGVDDSASGYHDPEESDSEWEEV